MLLEGNPRLRDPISFIFIYLFPSNILGQFRKHVYNVIEDYMGGLLEAEIPNWVDGQVKS
jgi:hypothetical protein